MFDQSNSQGDAKFENSDGVAGTPDSIANHEVPQLQDYHVREEDDEVTSSDDEADAHQDSSFRSWFSRSRHHKSTTESVSPVKLEVLSSSEGAIAEGTPNRCGSNSSFRKGIKSLFRRDSANDLEEPEVEDDNAFTETPLDGAERTDDDNKTNDENEVLPETPTSNRFWRSWRSGHHHHHRNHRYSIEVPEALRINEEADPATLRNPSLDVESMISHEEKRQKNMVKLVDQLEDVSANPSPDREAICLDSTSTPEKQDSDVESADSRASASSSVERALNVRERVGLVFSASPAENGEREQDEISPLTPPGDVLENPYKYVFDRKEDNKSLLAQDATLLYKYCKTFDNLDSALKLLTRDTKGLRCSGDRSNVSLYAISNELLELLEHEMLCRDRSAKEREIMADELISLQKQITSLRSDHQDKDAKIVELQKQLDAANSEIGKMANDLDEAAEEVDMLTQEVGSYKTKIQEVKTQERKAIEDLEARISQLNDEKEVGSNEKEAITKEGDLLREKLEELQSEHKNLIFDHEILQEKHSITTARLADLAGSFNKGQGQEKNMRENLEATSDKLRRYENTIEILKIGNLKIQENFHRERRKVLDLRQEVNYHRKQLQLIECHRSQSLQFMSHLMFYYRGIVSDETMTQYDLYLKKLSSSDFSPKAVNLTGDELKAYFKEREEFVVKFYNDIAKQSFLDQVISKHVSYMRSNKFLSSQLAGLRKHLDEYEQNVNRLLKEIQRHKKVEQKNKKTIALLQETNNEYKSKLPQIAN